MKQWRCLTALVLVLTACSPVLPTSFNAKTEQAKRPEIPLSPWRVSAETDELTGQRTVTAITGSGDESIVIRKRGKVLDCYLTTGQL